MGAGFLSALLFPAHAVGPAAETLLSNSIKPVVTAPVGPINPHKAFILRQTLQAGESSADMTFEVALKLRNLSELQGRVERGERISLQEMAMRYQPSQADYEAVANWVSGQGLTIIRRDSHHMSLFAHGSVDQVRQALKVNFARVSFEGKEYTSATTAPSVPAALSPLLVGINGLQPHLRAHKHIIRRQAQANVTSGTQQYLPGQIAQAYNASTLYSSNITGSGQTIAIVIDTFPAKSDLTSFWQTAGVSQTVSNVQFIQAVSGTLDSPSGEETLDVEWSGAMAPGAHVRVYAATDLANADLDTAYQQVYDDVTNHPEYNLNQMSMSYGEGETYTTSSQVQTDDQYFLELAAAGVTCFASSGDDGSTPGPGFADGSVDESGTLQVETPASDPNVTGVGGTTLVLGSGNSVTSETVWNNSIGASGGGASTYFGRPVWQTGSSVPTNYMRMVPDVACTADPDHGATIVLGGSQEVVGGTSWACPIWAGFCALINQSRANASLGSIGVLGAQIYPLLNSSSYSNDFRDITSGGNTTYNSDGDYAATTGFDEASGIGTPKMQTLSSDLVAVELSSPVQSPAASQTVSPGFNAAFTVTVSSGTPTYQWQRMPIGTSTWSNLSDDGTYVGSTGPTLTINNTTTGMSGDQFQCLVNLNGNVVATNPPSVLIVDSPLTISALAGKVGTAALENGTGTGAEFNYPSGIALDSSGNLYIADYGNNNIRKVTTAGVVTTPFGSLSGTAGKTNSTGNSATFNSPNGIAADSLNNLYVADTGNNLIRKIAGTTVSTIGTGTTFNGPNGIAVDSSQNVYVADSGNNVIRKITPGGVVSVIAGQLGTAGYADGNATTQALFNYPTGVAVDSAGNVYVADFNNVVVRKISGGTVSTIAGQQNVVGYADGLAANALFDGPIGIAIDGAGNLYVADSTASPDGALSSGNDVLRKITPAGVVSTVAGKAMAIGSTNDTGTKAEFYSLQAVAISSSGQFYLADTYNQTIRQGAPAVVTPAKIISLSGSLAFGNVTVNTTSTRTLTISNTGNQPLTVSSISYPDGYSGNWASGTIAADSSQNVTVTFAPTSTTTYTGNITVTSDANSGTNTIAISGTGYIPPTKIIALSGSLAFGGVTIKTTSSSTLTISNSGNTTLNVNSITYPTGFSGNWTSGAVASGSFQNITVTFAPTVVSNYGGNINISSDATTGTNTIVATGQGLPIPVVPATTTGSATDVQAQIATVSATSDPKSYATSVYFQYGTVPTYDSTTISQNIGSGTANVTFTANLTGLIPATTYYYRSVATNIAGTVYGAAKTFKTLTEPNITANATVYLGAAGSEISESVIPNGTTTTAYFQYGTTTSYGSHTTAQNIGSGKTAVNVFAQLPYLTPNTPYYYQLVTTSAAGTFYGPAESFTTPADVTTAVVQTGTAATGVPGALYSVLGNPIINDADNVAFAATLTGTGITTANNSGIWLYPHTGTPQLVARTGITPAPLTAAPASTYGLFASLSDPVYNNNETVAFRATLKVVTGEATSATALGIWSFSGGSLSLVARQGSPAPGYPSTVTFSGFTSLALSDQGPVFLGTLNSNSAAKITSSNNVGLWQVQGGTLQLVVSEGAMLNGKTVTALQFLPTLAYVNGQSRSFTQASGDLTFLATFSDKTTGIFKVVAGTPQLVVSEKGLPAGVASAEFLTLGNPAINANDHTAFAATMVTGPGGVTTANNTGIWAVDNTQLVARMGITPAPLTLPPVSGYGLFATLGDPVYDDTDAVAFRATLKVVTGQATSSTATGIWSNAGGTLDLVARQGSQAAGCPTGATFSTFTELALPDQGGAVFLATLNSNSAAAVSSSNNQGIWAVDTNGNLQLIVRTGDILNGKTITALKFLPALSYVNGQSRSFTQSVGDLTYEATFSDKSTGIFTVTFP